MPEMNYRMVETGGQGDINGGILKPGPIDSEVHPATTPGFTQVIEFKHVDLVRAYHRQHRLEIMVVRIFNTRGSHIHPDDNRIVSNFVVHALQRCDRPR
jgi:nucleoside-diphosphate-sugar epimerase